MKVFFGLTEVAGYYSRLLEGMETQGVQAEFITLTNHKYEYHRRAPNSLLPRLISSLLRRERDCKFRVGSLIFRVLARYVLRVPLFLWCLVSFDVFVFSYGFSFFSLYDLPILKIFDKKIVFQFHGSDSRPPYIDGPFLKDKEVISEQALTEIKRKRRQIDRINRYANVIIDTPTAGHFHSRPFVNWMAIGIPSTLPQQVACPGHRDDRIVRILHSPSDPMIKGTGEIRKHIEELREELEPGGFEIEYVEVTGRPHAEVLRELDNCDIVVDQVYADYGMPGFASEAAAYGRPVVIGGYAAPLWNREHPNDIHLPTHYVVPEEVKGVIRRLIVDPRFREESGCVHRRFVEENWTASLVAERYIRLIKGEILPSWLVDSKKILYVHGCGISEKRVRDMIRGLIDRFGNEGLQVTDKPDLVRRFEEFARE